MKISRFTKVAAVILMMEVCGIYSLMYKGLDNAVTHPMLIPAAVMFIGVVACIYHMRNTLKDVLASACFFTGLFMIIVSYFSYGYLGDLTVSSVGMFIGLLSTILGFSVWCGYDFGISGIRYVFMLLLAIQILGFWSYSRVGTNKGDITIIVIILLTLALEIAIVVLSLDKSMGYSGESTMSRHNLKMQGVSLANMEDGYILKKRAEEIRILLRSDREGKVTTRLFSNNHGDKKLEVFKDADGKSCLVIYDMSGSGSSLMSMEITETSLMSDTFTMYGKDGQWTRLLVYDSIQEDFTKPKLFGKERGSRTLQSLGDEFEDETVEETKA